MNGKRTTFSAILQRGDLALERLHLHCQCPTQIPQLPKILKLGLFGGNAGRQSRRWLGGGLTKPCPGKHRGWSWIRHRERMWHAKCCLPQTRQRRLVITGFGRGRWAESASHALGPKRANINTRVYVPFPVPLATLALHHPGFDPSARPSTLPRMARLNDFTAPPESIEARMSECPARLGIPLTRSSSQAPIRATEPRNRSSQFNAVSSHP